MASTNTNDAMTMTFFGSGAACSQIKSTNSISFYLIQLWIVDCGLRNLELEILPRLQNTDCEIKQSTLSLQIRNPQSAIRNHYASTDAAGNGTGCAMAARASRMMPSSSAATVRSSINRRSRSV